MAARDEDFLNDGTVDPFTGLAPAETPEEEATRRLLKLRYSAQQTANTNNAPGGYTSQRGVSDRDAIEASNRYVRADRIARTGSAKGDQDGFWKNLSQDPVTMGILAAPAAITGLGAAVGGAGALGFGLGEGSIAGAAAPGIPAMGQPFTMATPTAFSMPSPYAAGTAGAGTAMGAPAASAGGSAASGGGGAAGFFNSVGKPALQALAPLAIQQLTKGPTKEQKQLIELQKQMAHEAQVRQGQLQDQRMNQLGQQVLAFNPTNQLMSQMYGPQAAFTPEQAAQMVQGQEPAQDPNLMNYAGNDQNILKQKQEMIRRHNEWLAAEQQRREMVMNNFQAPGAGPAPINMPAPQAARRF